MMNHMRRIPHLPQKGNRGVELKIESIKHFLKRMKDQGVPNMALSVRDYQNSLIVRRVV